ncbi:hypothetical protein REPUB_Repub08aG0180800 [Reevesia pubescens]
MPRMPRFYTNSFCNQRLPGALPFIFDDYEDDDDDEDPDYEALDNGGKYDAPKRKLGEENDNTTSDEDLDKLKTDEEPCDISSSGLFTRVFGWTKHTMLACLCL